MRISRAPQVIVTSMFIRAFLYAATGGTITAKVVDLGSRSVANATVLLTPVKQRISAAVIPACLTGKDGTCSIELVQFGKYHVTAMKESAGYPNPTFNFYGHGRWPNTVEVSPSRPNIKVTIKLGPKAASIILRVIDAQNSAPIGNVTAIVNPVNNPRNFFSTSLGPNSTVLIPCDEDVQLEVTAKGYKPWFLTEHREVYGGKPLRFHSAQKVSLTILLNHE